MRHERVKLENKKIGFNRDESDVVVRDREMKKIK